MSTVTGRAVVVGLGLTGDAVARQLLARGWAVTALEDRPNDASAERARALVARGATVHEQPPVEVVLEVVDAADLVLPSPGIPATHPATSRALATGTTVWTEFELAARWTDLPIVAVTGTNGKTTVTTLIEQMLAADGRKVVSAGNNDLPLVDALDLDLDLLVVEASSFRLAFTETFRPAVAVWLNLAEDHLDWHGTMDDYAAAKARIWASQGPDDVAVANADDPVVLAATEGLPSQVVTFGLRSPHAGWRVADGALVGPDGAQLLAVADLPRALPHDLANALAAAAAATAAGTSAEAIRTVLREFGGLPHRLTLIAEHGGVRYYDDSKATDPHAAAAAVSSFESVVLLAGGRNKGLDLGLLAEEAARLRGVVAMGDAADEVIAAFEGTSVPVTRAASMDAAVGAARAAAHPGDVVLLSPGCASYDWYSGFAERGDDFARAVRASLQARP